VSRLRRRAAFGAISTLLLIGSLASLSSFRLVNASGTIYIRADGSVDPSTASVERDGDNYAFTANISDQIVAERNSVVVDGSGYALQLSGAYYGSKGLNLTRRSSVRIRNMRIAGFHYGIWLSSCSNSNVSGNNATGSGYSIYLGSSSNNSINGNNITLSSEHGICLDSSD
jgi:parallel beta-helix repeat protein